MSKDELKPTRKPTKRSKIGLGSVPGILVALLPKVT